MKTCNKCGASCPDEMNFCNACGAKLEAEETIVEKSATEKPLGLIEATKIYFKKYADFSGRASKAEFWWSYLGTCIIGFIAGLTLILAPIACLGLFIPSLAAMARRLHDMGKSGWWLVLNFVGLGIVPLIMCIMDGEDGPNQYGEKPER